MGNLAAAPSPHRPYSSEKQINGWPASTETIRVPVSKGTWKWEVEMEVKLEVKMEVKMKVEMDAPILPATLQFLD